MNASYMFDCLYSLDEFWRPFYTSGFALYTWLIIGCAQRLETVYLHKYFSNPPNFPQTNDDDDDDDSHQNSAISWDLPLLIVSVDHVRETMTWSTQLVV